MASIEQGESWGKPVYRVKWRDSVIKVEGKNGLQPKAWTITCSDPAQADKLCALVDEAGQTVPAERILDAYGLTWILGVGREVKFKAPEQPKDITNAELCRRYLRFKKDAPKPPSDETMVGYEQYVRDHVETHWFGSLLVNDTDQNQARRWQREIADKPNMSATTAMKVRGGVVAPAFKWGTRTTRKDELALRTWTSPFEGLGMLEMDYEPRDILENLAEIHAFIECAYEVDENWADLVVAKLCGGHRFGEITVVAANAVRSNGVELLQKQTRGQIRKGTKAGRNKIRFTPLPGLVMTNILFRKGQAGSPKGLIYAGPRGNKWASTSYERRWEWLGEKLAERGIQRDLTGHCLRHTCTSMLQAAGINADIVHMMTGHAPMPLSLS